MFSNACEFEMEGPLRVIRYLFSCVVNENIKLYMGYLKILPRS